MLKIEDLKPFTAILRQAAGAGRATGTLSTATGNLNINRTGYREALIVLTREAFAGKSSRGMLQIRHTSVGTLSGTTFASATAFGTALTLSNTTAAASTQKVGYLVDLTEAGAWLVMKLSTASASGCIGVDVFLTEGLSMPVATAATNFATLKKYPNNP